MLVKHPHGYSSVGLRPSSLVTGEADLRREVSSQLHSHHGALIEAFLPGREFTVLVGEAREGERRPWALVPLEVIFPPGETFQHFDLKWRHPGALARRLVDDPVLEARLREAASLIFEALGGSGYARCDFRLDANGELTFLEINPNCGIFYPEDSFGSADDILANDPAGFRGFLDHLLQCARRRQWEHLPRWQLEYHPDRGFGMVASRALEAGECIHSDEERPHVLASRQHVEAAWEGIHKDWFADYAYPLSDDLHVLWSSNPEEWRPINHSCDPNSWLDGLKLVARRPIPRGEEISLDYATFCGPDMNGFVCTCGAPDCRGVITSVDHLLPDLECRYGVHLSSYVRQARTRLAPRVHPPYERVPHPAGHGLVARRSWREGETIAPFRWGELHPLPSRWTLQRGAGEHAEPLPIELRYINHSCCPNVVFDFEASAVRALRAIEPGDDLTFFYPATEWRMHEPFSCSCGAPECLGTISGAASLNQEVLTRYELSPTIRDLLERPVVDSSAAPAETPGS
jgi:D-alanine-D-alanine ligase